MVISYMVIVEINRIQKIIIIYQTAKEKTFSFETKSVSLFAKDKYEGN